MDDTVKSFLLNLGVTVVILGLGWYKQWTKLQDSQNRFGERLNTCEKGAEEMRGELRATDRSCRDNMSEQANMRERIAANETNIANVKEVIQQSQIEVMSKLFDFDKAAAGRDALIMEKLGRLDERLDLTKLLPTIIREIKQ